MKGLPNRTRRRRLENDPWRRVRIGVTMLAGVTLVGFIGYLLMGLSAFDSLYMTVITITTVGFSEIGEPDQITATYQTFTLLLALFGVGTALYTLGVSFEALVEGSINDGLQIRRGLRMIDKQSDHIIVVGNGRVGQAIVHYVGRHGADVVLVDRNPQPESDWPVVIGDATEDQTLRNAGIDRATTLIAALDSDSDNVYVTLSARALNPKLHIVARTDHQHNEAKFFHAGADRVVNPYEIGGSRMGALAMHPTLAEFLDEVLHDESHGVTVDEIEVPPASSAVGKPLGDLVGPTGQPLVIALRDADHGYVANPAPTTPVPAGTVLVVLGSDADVAALASRV
ncbi:MAG: potassium channel protein [Actinomycetota bacterium]